MGLSAETAFIERLRALATHPAARGLRDDAAVLTPPAGRDLVLTHDMIVEGVHYLPSDSPADVAWKLVAVNLSDLAAKGAELTGVLLGYSLGDPAWDAVFVGGLAEVLARFKVPLLGGDTVSGRPGTPRSFGLTAIGSVAPGGAPSRGGARPGDMLWVSGTIGDAGAGLRIALGEIAGPDSLIRAYRRPEPRLAAGIALAPRVGAMADVSDGLLIDAARMADASGCAVEIDLDRVPLSPALATLGNDRRARLAAVTAGDDYELLFAAAPGGHEALLGLCKPLALTLTPVGRFTEGSGLTVFDAEGAVPLPARLGYEHEGDRQG